jgi:hypothetical protein
MKIAYLVNNGASYSSYEICGIFKTEADALDWIEQQIMKHHHGKVWLTYDKRYCLEEWPVGFAHLEWEWGEHPRSKERCFTLKDGKMFEYSEED